MILEKQLPFVFSLSGFVRLLHLNRFLFGEEAGVSEDLLSISRMGP